MWLSVLVGVPKENIIVYCNHKELAVPKTNVHFIIHTKVKSGFDTDEPCRTAGQISNHYYMASF